MFSKVRHMWLAVLCLAILLNADVATHLAKATFYAATPSSNYPVAEHFLHYWSTNGATLQLGNPVSPAQREASEADGKVYETQYFERARLEYHPEQKDPRYTIMIGMLGRESLLARYPTGTDPSINHQQVVPGDSSYTFSQTGKTVMGYFLSYWQSHGSLTQIGYPLTDAFYETSLNDGRIYLAQYFERARFEYHPEQSDPRYRVMLGLVGVEARARRQAPVGCRHGVSASFQQTLQRVPSLAHQLGCPTDDGQAGNGLAGGYQSFERAGMLVSTSTSTTGYAYVLYPDGTYQRTSYQGVDLAGGVPPTAGPHFYRAARAFAPLGSAMAAENWQTSIAVQNYEHGLLLYVAGSGYATNGKDVFAIMPTSPSGGFWRNELGLVLSP